MKRKRFIPKLSEEVLLRMKVIRVVGSVRTKEHAKTACKFVILAHKRFIEMSFEMGMRNDGLITQCLNYLNNIISMKNIKIERVTNGKE